MNLSAIQAALKGAAVDGWLFCDFHHRDLMAYRILGLDPAGMTTRRWFYFVPAEGQPKKLAHRVEPRKLDSLPGEANHFLGWRELHEKLRGILGPYHKIAMQYSPLNNIPYVSVVDAGTIELVRSFGKEIVSSADFIQTFEAVTGEAGHKSHRDACEKVQQIKDETFERMRRALRDKTPVTEFELKEHIVARFGEERLTCEGESPIVGFNDHPADPHFEPTRENAYTLKANDTILLDLWAKQDEPGAIYYDITWCAFAGANPPAEYVKIFSVAAAARDAAVEFLRSRLSKGQEVRGFEVDDACRKVVVDAGYGDQFLHRTGHSIGTSVHGNGANIDNLETRDERRIVPGACFSIEPGIYLAGRMAVRSEINVYVTPDNKAEVYGAIQKDLLLLT